MSNCSSVELDFTHVAIVDDEPVVLHLLAQQLKCFGVRQCDLYTRGEEALASIAELKPDLVICDLKLPDIDGPQLIRGLADAHYQGSLAIITGSDSRILQTLELLATELGLHVLGSFTKPVNPCELEWMFSHSNKPQANQMQQYRKPSLQALDETTIDQQLGQALTPYYQAKFDLASAKISGFEVLARWRTPDGQILGPGAFIPKVERSGRLTPFTMLLLDKVLEDSEALLADDPNLNFAINFGLESLQDRALPETLMARLEKYTMTPANLTIELTERGLGDNVPNILEVMARLHLLGFKLSIDDFGTGYSSLSRAKRLPFTELKIDRAFVMDAGESSSSRAVINSSVALANDLDMQIIAEGVETPEQLALMAQLGCQVLQGYHISRPVPLSEVAPLLATGFSVQTKAINGAEQTLTA